MFGLSRRDRSSRSLSRMREERDPFLALQNEMNRLFNDFYHGFEMEPFERQEWTPKVDIADAPNEITVTAELPGMDEKDVEVTLSNDVLSIRGERKEEKEDKQKNYVRRESFFGSFQRDIPLPANVEREKIDAAFKKGVLTIKLPKSKEHAEAARKIEVKAS